MTLSTLGIDASATISLSSLRTSLSIEGLGPIGSKLSWAGNPSSRRIGIDARASGNHGVEVMRTDLSIQQRVALRSSSKPLRGLDQVLR